MGKTYKIKEIAEECGVCISTIHKAIYDGALGDDKVKKAGMEQAIALTEEQAKILRKRCMREKKPDDGRYHSMKEVSTIIGVTSPCIVHKITTGLLDPLPKKYNGRYAFTEEDIDRLRDLCVGGKTLQGQKYDKDAEWPLLYNPLKLKKTVKTKVEVIVEYQKQWHDYLNGHWTWDKPRTIGWHAVIARDMIAPKYKYFRNDEEKNQWVGMFWSAPVPDPPAIGKFGDIQYS